MSDSLYERAGLTKEERWYRSQGGSQAVAEAATRKAFETIAADLALHAAESMALNEPQEAAVLDWYRDKLLNQIFSEHIREEERVEVRVTNEPT